MSKTSNIKEVAQVFFKLGCIAFGGPAAHIAMMEDEIVVKRKWISRQHFLDLMGATNLIPGPNSTEMTMHCGHERAGVLGLFVAGISFIFPAVVLTGLLAWVYVTYNELPQVEAFVFGIKPAVLVIILGAVIKLGKKALKNFELIILGVLVLIASILGANEIVALLLAGVLGAIYFYIKNNRIKSIQAILPLLSLGLLDEKTIKTFLSFLKVGAVLYGSGYVLFAYLDAELVQKGLLTQQQLLDAIAIGQFTPGPVLSTATFIGYQLNGFWGAVAATLGIFLPSFLFVWLLNPLVHKMRESVFLSGFLNCVNAAAVAIMAAVLVEMGQAVLNDWRAWVILAVSAFFTFGPKKLNAMFIVLGGALLGYVLSLV